MKKNEIVDSEITALTHEGMGIAKIDGIVVFVPNSAVGDKLKIKIVKVNKNYCYGIIDEITEPSKDRIEPKCAVFKQCGGCTFGHISYNAECEVKENYVKDCFLRMGKIETEFLPIVPCDYTENYRNKAQYPVGFDGRNAYCGFYAKHSHRIIDCKNCKLQPKIFSNILNDTLEFINKNKISVYDEENNKGLVRHIYLRRGAHSRQIVLCIVTTKDTKIFNDFAEKIAKKYNEIKSVVLNINAKKTNVILGEHCKIIYGTETITDIMCGNEIALSPLSFYQVNTLQAEKLYEKAKEFANVNADDTIIDLYCGAGTIGLSFAKDVKKVIGVEIIPEAVENAKENAKKNGIENAEFICADAGKAFAELKTNPDLLILDPPRKGCSQDLLKTIVDYKINKIVMISCNPATAARDCKYLSENGYIVEKIKPFDLFPRTSHVECVIQIMKNKN